MTSDPAYNLKGHDTPDIVACHHMGTRCEGEASSACIDGHCTSCCEEAGDGDGACTGCKAEHAAILADIAHDTRRAPAARTGPFTVDHIVCCDICHRANLRRGMFHVVGYTDPVCARCVSELRESEAALR